ncbi:hypothetical protein [Streptomyces sp. NK15101]|uniref:hypothetical protein n=1 Tax=Streptomyces sp. NK15101 TaxID=2873261 RepID=UPI001CED05E2|nr:hypothetical protein [Streptomyces sp. NK15101]
MTGARDAALESGEVLPGEYAVRPPVVDGRPGRPLEESRFALRLTGRGLQFRHGADRIRSHIWSEVRLTPVKQTLLLVHQGTRYSPSC